MPPVKKCLYIRRRYEIENIFYDLTRELVRGNIWVILASEVKPGVHTGWIDWQPVKPGGGGQTEKNNANNFLPRKLGL